MTPERREYEAGYLPCARCKTSRPARCLSGGICSDGWCEKVLPANGTGARGDDGAGPVSRDGRLPKPPISPARALPARSISDPVTVADPWGWGK